MILILEGPECSGKTTLAGEICDAFREHGGQSFAILKSGPPDPPGRSPFEEYELSLLNAVREMPEGSLIICDRHSLGEAVYGPLLRGSSRLTPGGLLHCEMLHEAIGAVRWVTMPPLAALVNRLQARAGKPTLIDTDDLTHVYQAYEYLAPRYCYTKIQPPLGKAAIDVALRTMRLRDERAAEITAVAPGYIGSLFPSMVLAGDERSSVLPADPYLHAFTPARNGSASYLMDALATSSRYVIRSTGILNTGEDGADLAAAAKVFGGPRWVALGQRASGRLDAAGITHEMAYHPSHERRFRSHKRTPHEYADALLAAGGTYHE